MKRFFTALALTCIMVLSASAGEPWTPTYATLLKKYTSPEGVDYQGWKANGKDLETLQTIVNQIEQKGPSDTSREGQIAYYTDVYNILVLHGVLKAYPTKSVSDIAPLFGFFKEKGFTVEGEKVSLNQIEKEMLLKQFQEPRIHFIINCASISCPPLLPEPLTAGSLEGQMDAATRTFVNQNPEGVRVEGNKAFVSKIFDWYKGDFDDAGGIVAFINQYRDKKLPDGVKVEFQEYNWGLNEGL